MELKVHDQEILLQKLWNSRKLLKHEMKTASGESVEILFAGTQNFDAGPDFKNAIIKMDNQIIRGDIEVHLESSGWYSHGHQADPAYNQVVLHLVAKLPNENETVEREDGVRVSQIHIDIDFQQLEAVSGTENAAAVGLVVSNCPLSRTSDDKIMSTLAAASVLRFKAKIAQLRERLNDLTWDQLMYENICVALGYSKNQQQFRRLAEKVQFERIVAEMQWVAEDTALKKCTALLFGTAGFMPSQYDASCRAPDSELLDYMGSFEDLWAQMSHRLDIRPMQHHEWQFFRLRPSNFPTRRLAGLALLVSRFYKTGLLKGFLQILRSTPRDYKRILSECERRLVVNTEGFWPRDRHVDSEIKPAALQKSLIGKDRSRDILVNIVFPILHMYGTETHDGKTANLVVELFERLPKLPHNAITRAMLRQLHQGRESATIDLKFASQQQGLIHLHKLYCQPLNCKECLDLRF